MSITSLTRSVYDSLYNKILSFSSAVQLDVFTVVYQKLDSLVRIKKYIHIKNYSAFVVWLDFLYVVCVNSWLRSYKLHSLSWRIKWISRWQTACFLCISPCKPSTKTKPSYKKGQMFACWYCKNAFKGTANAKRWLKLWTTIAKVTARKIYTLFSTYDF